MRSFITQNLEKFICSFKALILLYKKYYDRVVQSEVDLLSIGSGDRVLCIGGGSVPCTAINLAYMTGSRVDVIDTDEEAVENARRVVEMLDLGDQIRVQAACGTSIDVSDYDAIHIALQVCPKDMVLGHILRGSKNNARILMRMPKKRLEYDYSTISKKGIDDLLIELRGCGHRCALRRSDRVNSRANTMDESLVFVKS